MKPTNLAVLTALGMLLTSVSVYSLTPPGGLQIGSGVDPRPVGSQGSTVEQAQPKPVDLVDETRFTAGSTLDAAARVLPVRSSMTCA